jgi:hypothetical protein
VDAGYAGQLHVHKDDCRLMDVCLMQGLVAVFGLCHHCQARIGFEQSAKSNAEHWMIVDDHDPALQHGGVSLTSSTF